MDLLGDPLARDEVTGLGAAMAGGKARLSKTARRARDYYPTPPEATRALIVAESAAILAHGTAIWEPCGYGGAIVRELDGAGHGFRTIASDICADPAHRVAEADLLAVRTAWAPIVITNPPFALAGRMIEHMLGGLRVDYLALLLKTQFWSTNSEDRGRLGLWRRFPPQRRWDCTWRVDFTGGRASTMNVSWFIWDAEHIGPRTWGLLTPSGPADGSADLFGG